MSDDAAPIVGAAVEFYPGEDDPIIGICPAVITNIHVDGTTTDLEVFEGNGAGQPRNAVISERVMINRALDPVRSLSKTAYWAWPPKNGGR